MASHQQRKLSLALVLTSGWQLQAAHREQRNTLRGAATPNTTNQLSPRGTQTLPAVRSCFIATLPETTKISAVAMAKGEEKPLVPSNQPG